MAAEVTAISEYPEDVILTLQAECLDCVVILGRGPDKDSEYRRLLEIVEKHNKERHN